MILGIDIGGTTTKIGIMKEDKLVFKYTIKTIPKTLILDIINSFREHNLDIKKMKCIGCAVPGFIDHKKGIITLSGNLGYKNFEFKKIFEQAIGTSVSIINDANAAALGEYWIGAGKDFESMILYTLGTGIGGGVILNNELIFGNNSYAGEFGHGGFFQDQRKCACGLDNCIEPMSSAKGIEQSIFEIYGKKINLIDAKTLLINGDVLMIKAFNESLTPLANHIAIMETAINPAIVVIGGGPSMIGKPLIDLISNLVKKKQLDFIHKSTPIVQAKTGNDAGMIGAAYWAKITQEK